MKKFLCALFLAAFCAISTRAQFTLVSGTVTDSNNVAYACGTITATLVNNSGISPTLNGLPFNGFTSPVKLGCPTDPTTSRTAGAFTMQLADNTVIKCPTSANPSAACSPQTQWLFTVNTTGVPPPLGTGPQSCTATLTISGGSQSITSNFSACPVLSAVSGATGALSTTIDSTQSPYNVVGDGKYACGATITNGSPTMTLSATDPPFKTTDVGFKVYGTTAPNCGVGAGGTTILQGTIVTVNSPTSATCSANATGGGNVLVWAKTDNTSGLNSAWTVANTTPCKLLILPSGGIMITGLIQAPSANCTVFGNGAVLTNAAGVLGQGAGTYLLPFPTTDYTNATVANGGAFFGVTGSNNFSKSLQNFSLFGGGVLLNNTNAVAFYGGYASSFQNLGIMGWGSADFSTGVYLAGAQNVNTSAFNTQVFGAGQACHLNGYTTFSHGFCFGNNSGGILVDSSAGPVFTDDNQFSCLVVNCIAGKFQGSAAYSTQDYFNSGTNSFTAQIGSGTVTLDSDQIIGSNATFALDNGFGATVHAKNTTISMVAGANPAIRNLSPSVFFNDGGNFFTGTISNTGSWIADGHSLKGICTGTATANTTLGLYGSGPNVTLTTCTSATIGSGITIGGPHTLQHLFVTATHAGVNASSGLVTVLQNGVATTITCTVGTATSCSDTTHSVTLADGDLISIQFTTQLAEVLAGVKAIVEWN